VGRRHRFVLVPILNVDGRERFPEHTHSIGCTADNHSLIVMGRKQDGEILRWPDGMRVYPVPVEEMSPLGSYYNDAGLNLFEDLAFGGLAQPETQALFRLCARELPDCTILSHTDNGSLVQPPSAFVPAHYQQRSDEVGALVGMRCAREGFPKYRIPDSPTLYAGDYFCQSDAVYHACGALPLVIEFPYGGPERVPGTHREILDLGLAVLDEVALFGSIYRFRPPEPRAR
jgi:hypothetical protein